MMMITFLAFLALFVSGFVTLFRRGEDEWLQCHASKYLTFILLLQGNSGLRCKSGVQFPVIPGLTSRVAGSTAARASGQTRGTRALSPPPETSRLRSQQGICN